MAGVEEVFEKSGTTVEIAAVFYKAGETVNGVLLTKNYLLLGLGLPHVLDPETQKPKEIIIRNLEDLAWRKTAQDYLNRHIDPVVVSDMWPDLEKRIEEVFGEILS